MATALGRDRLKSSAELVRARGARDTAFVDAVCDPPETFASGDPIEWERRAA